MKMIGVMLKKSIAVAFSPKYLLASNTVTCSALLGVGDAVQQKIGMYFNTSHPPFDMMRTLRVIATGIVLGPMNHYWYRLLDGKLPGVDMRTLLKKISVDMCSCPAFSAVFVVGVGLLEGQSPKSALQEYKDKFFTIFSVFNPNPSHLSDFLRLQLDLSVWPVTQFVNFWLLPPQARVVYVSTVQVFYNSCISYIKHEDSIRGSRLTFHTHVFGGSSST